MEIDEVWTHIGEFGSSQKLIFYCLSLVQIFACLQVFIFNFVGVDPGWRCRSGVGETSSTTVVTARCQLFKEGNCVPEYSKEFTSIVTEWDMICDKDSLPNLSQSVFFVGNLVGMWLFGTLSDKFGRRKVFFLGFFIMSLSSLGCAVAPGFYIFTFLRAIASIGSAGLVASYVLCMEVIGSSYRSFAGMVFQVFFSLGYPLLAVMAYYIRSWRTLFVVTTLSGAVVGLMWRVIPESPGWLLVNGHEDEAKAVLMRIAQGNRKPLHACELKKPESESNSGSSSTLDLFRGKNICHRTIVLFCMWFTVCMVYYGLSMNAGNLGGDHYIGFSLSGLIEIPSLAVAYFLVDRWGRKWTNATFFFTGGLACLSWALLRWLGSNGTVKFVMALVGKFAVAGSFAIIYLFSAELFPTTVRNLGVGLCSSVARVGGIIAPLTLLMAQYSEGLPMLLMGCLALLTGTASLTLPETLNKPLPKTLAELELR